MALGDRGKTEPDELAMKHKFKMKCRFRAIVRLALENAYWLTEEVEEPHGIDSIKKRVAQVMRGKQPKKRMLTLKDKALLNKPAEDRNVREKKYIYRIIGGLKCFKRYPNLRCLSIVTPKNFVYSILVKHVKRRLAAVTYFQYYKPGHVIVRQDQEAHAMYFIMSGEITVSHMVYDELLIKDVPVEIGILHADDVIGELSLLHNLPRTTTCTTLSHCELLILRKEDFKNILHNTLQASLDKVRLAMSFFNYFDGLDEVSKREGSIMAKMMNYSQNDIVLGDGVGFSNYVYFVISGCCQMIETLRVSSVKISGHTIYRLYDPHVSRDESEEESEEDIFNSLKSFTKLNVTSRKSSMNLFKSKSVNAIMKRRQTLSQESKVDEKDDKTDVTQDQEEVIDDKNRASVVKVSYDLTQENKSPEQVAITSNEDMYSEIDLLSSQKVFRDAMRLSSVSPLGAIPSNLRTYFMQVCQYNPGSTFGIGENMRDRRIVALTPANCMLLPKAWLFEHNVANIWTRVKHFLDKKIPDKKDLFKTFVMEQNWMEYRDKLIEGLVTQSKVFNCTTVHDVPYSIRMEEMLNL